MNSLSTVDKKLVSVEEMVSFGPSLVIAIVTVFDKLGEKEDSMLGPLVCSKLVRVPS